MVAPAGATPWPQITSVLPRLTSWTMSGTSPPGPWGCGSTTCSVNAVATAASKALPPRSSIAMPTAVAIQCVDVTTPKVPSISGRVVNEFGLILVIRDSVSCKGREPRIETVAGEIYLAAARAASPRIKQMPRQVLKVGMAGLGAVGLEVARRLETG